MRRRFVRHWKQKNMQSISEWMLKAWNECCKGIGSVTSSSIDFRRELKEIISLTCFPVISILKFWPQTKYIPVGSLSNHVCQMHCKNVVYFKYLKLKACFLVRLVRSHQENFVTLKIFPRKKKRLKGCWSSKKIFTCEILDGKALRRVQKAPGKLGRNSEIVSKSICSRVLGGIFIRLAVNLVNGLHSGRE